ncbi:MAG: respiratory nitrate reductase subunit gamma, partial [Actinomycetota bacterium]
MSATTHDAAEADAPTRRLKPHQLSLVLFFSIAGFTAVSGILPQITGWKSDSPIHRVVFTNIPGPLQIAFYSIMPVMLVWVGIMFSHRMKNWERGAPAMRRTSTKNAKQRLKDFRAGVYMKTLLRDAGAGLMHSMIYFGFLGLLAVTTVLEIDHQMPEALKFLHGDVYKGYVAFGDTMGLIFMGGMTWAIVRRYVQRPYRIRIKSKPEHAIILGTLFAVGLTGFGAEMFRIAQEGMPDYERWSYVGYPLATLVEGWSQSSLDAWHQWWWIGHVASFIVFLAILPVTMLRHIFTSPIN